MAVREVVVEREMPERGIRYFVTEQTTLSAITGLLGALSLSILVIGIPLAITANGWIPYQNITATIESTEVLVLLVASIALGAVATILGWATFRRMATKPSREAAVAGAVLGMQSVVLGGLFLWFRAGAVDVFARNFFQFQYITDFWERFVRGALNTLILALSGEAIGILLGLILAIFVLSSRAVVRAPARIYINFFRGTPLLWQIQFGFFAIILGLQINISTYMVAILVLGLNAGAYSAEIFRAGVQSIDRGQFEAARSVGMSYPRALRHIILPQAFRRVIPPLTNEFVILIKDTSLVSILGLTLSQQELLAVGGEIARTYFNATAFLGSAAGYLAICLPMIGAVSWLERRLRSGLTGIPG